MAPDCSHEVEGSIDDLIRENPKVDTKIGMSHLERLRWVAEDQIDYPREVWYRGRGTASPAPINLTAKHGPEEPPLIFACFTGLDPNDNGCGSSGVMQYAAF